MNIITFFLFLLFFLGAARPTYAHAFGQQFILPIPVSFYLYGCAVVLVATFVMVGIFQKRPAVKKASYTIKFRNPNALTFVNFFFLLLNLFSLAFFLLAIVSGFLGTQQPTQNFSMTYFWIIFFLGLTYFSAFIGNIWEIVNPLKPLVAVGFYIGLFGEKERFMHRFGYYPALFFYVVLIWFELVFKVSPFTLATLLTVYTVVSLFGIYFLGKKNWFIYYDFFSVFFGLIGKIAPVLAENNRLVFRYPFSALLQAEVKSFSLLLFIIFILASTAFDGFWETITWASIYSRWFLPIQNLLGPNGLLIIKTLALCIFPMLFLGLFLLTAVCMRVIVRSKYSVMQIIGLFAYTLIPIGFVYNVSHYYTLLLFQGQALVGLLSDPLGNGWDLFGTSAVRPNLQVVSTNFIWNSQVAAILLGHIVAVYLAHLVSLRVFQSQKDVVLSQIPMLLLMVIYTVFGLWILSQPIRGFS